MEVTRRGQVPSPQQHVNELFDVSKGVTKKRKSVLDSFVIFPIRQWLRFLSNLSDKKLFLLGTAVRAVVSIAAVVSHHVLPPLLFGERAGDRLYRDNSFTLYDDTRLSALRVWDGVHFFYIAQHGYIKENSLAFFPGLPMIIRFISFITKDLLPFLDYLAPVVLYVVLLNLVISGLTLVVLRRLTVLTLIGPHAVLSYSRGNPEPTEISWWCMQTGSFLDAPLRLEEPKVTEEEVEIEETRRATEEEKIISREKTFDASMAHEHSYSDSIQSPLFEKDAQRSSYYRHTEESKARRENLNQIVAASCFAWIISPTAIYASVAYTEAIYGFLTLLAVYLLSFSSVIPGTEVTENPRGYRGVVALLEARLNTLSSRYTSAEAGLRSLATSSGKKLTFLPSLTSQKEFGALLCLFIAGTFRSNALLYTGFFWYPIFIQIFMPDLYRRRVLQWYAPQWMPMLSSDSATNASSSRMIIRGVHPIGRWPLLRRIVTVTVYTLVVFSPSVAMNYFGWKHFTPKQFLQEVVLYPKNFMAFYSYVQNRFWGVGFLYAWTISNIPHIIVPMPLSIAIFTSFFLITCSGLTKRNLEEERIPEKRNATYVLKHKIANARLIFPKWIKGKMVARKGPQPKNGTLRLLEVEVHTVKDRFSFAALTLIYGFIIFLDFMERLLASSCISLLMVHLFIGLTIMNIHVTSRFIMGVPSLYWMIGQLIAFHPQHVVSRLVPYVFINFTLIGIGLFPNCFDWT